MVVKYQIFTGMLLSLVSLTLAAQQADQGFPWPEGARAAVNLAYDDALNSQLDNAMPALERYGFRGSFYLVPASASMHTRLEDWRAAAGRGHEMANHSLFHPCSGGKPGREWVQAWNDLDGMTVEEMTAEITVASTFLQALDGQQLRTLTTPCGDLDAGGASYVTAVKSQFVAIKSQIGDGVTDDLWRMDPWAVEVITPVNASGEDLVRVVQRAAEQGTMANFTFHGIGGDHLAVSKEAHDFLLQHLAAHPERYWVDTFLNIMQHVHRVRAETEQ